MRAFILTLLAIAAAATLHAQKPDYKAMSYSHFIYTVKKANYIRTISPKYISSDKKYVAAWNNYLYEVYENYTNASDKEQFISEPYVVQYLQAVLQTILDANHIDEKIEIVCTRYQDVNAYNMGDNRLYVNIGALTVLDNEAQLAFMLGHELSHYLLYHAQNRFNTVRSVATDKKVKAEMKDIEQAKYNKLDRAMQFAVKYRYTFANYSRVQERAADSMAIVLLQPTKYDIAEGQGLMRILRQSDSDRTTINYAQLLSANGNSLRSEVLQNNRYNISFGHKRVMEYEEDSIKSHPDIPQRISFIGEKVAAMNGREGTAKFIVSQPTFDSIKAAARYEIIESYYANERYAASIYHALSLLEQQPGNAYLIKRAAFSFKSVVESVKDHTIQDHIPVESDGNPPAYNQLLRIIDRTTLPELTQLYNNFLANYSAQLSDYPELKNVQ